MAEAEDELGDERMKECGRVWHIATELRYSLSQPNDDPHDYFFHFKTNGPV